MANNSFTHLRVHTEYSISESTLKLDELIDMAKKDGQPAIAMTDVDGLFGAIRFYDAARNAGIKPIIGVDIQFAFTADANSEPESPRRMVLIAKDYEGYKKLMRLITKAYAYNQIDDKPVLKEEWVRMENPNGLICLSGGDSGHIGAHAIKGDYQKAVENAGRLKNIFGENFFIEVQRRGAESDAAFVGSAVEIADQIGAPLVATQPMQFASQEGYLAHELRVCDATKTILPARDRQRNFTPQQHFLTSSEMLELFADLPDALQNAQAISQMCSLEIPLGKPMLPQFDTGTDESLDQFFQRKSHEGLEKRLSKLFPDPAERARVRPEYDKRLQYEIDTIKQMGFEGYFMIVYDFINWAHNHQVPVGPGRGSGAGSLVAYSLGITNLDPLKYELLFERFLNPERVSMPDFDIDFCIERRDWVVDYVTQRYGAEAVAGITAIGTMAARAAVNNAGRALGLPLPMYSAISQLIPNKPNLEMTLHKAMHGDPKKDLEPEKDLMQAYHSDPEVKKLLDHALTLEGLPRSVSRHAAGIVIAPGRIADFSPIYTPSSTIEPESAANASAIKGKADVKASQFDSVEASNSKAATQYDKDDIEKAGLVKFDFLGLKNLTIVQKAVDSIRKKPGFENFDINDIPLDDPAVFQLFKDCNTLAVFQFESDFMKGIISKVNPDCFEDIAALNALGRPGPMDLIPEFVSNKANPSVIHYMDERMKPILDETYGIMVYQEQVMKVAQVIGGYSLGEADILRKAMGKKKPEEMVKQRSKFVSGAISNGMKEEVADKLFSHMEKFAGYGFNKSHAVAYALIAYQTAFLKTHHPTEFFTAELTVDSIEDVEKVESLIIDAKKFGIKTLPPDINESGMDFIIDGTQDKAIRYSLAGLKSIGREAVRYIVEARKLYGKFESLEDFLLKVAKTVPTTQVSPINKTTIDRLIEAGAFDKLHDSRVEMKEALPVIQKYIADVKKRDAKIKGQAETTPLDSLFALSGVEAPIKKPKAPKAPKPIPEVARYEWPRMEKQNLMEKLLDEHKAFGFYFSAHPMAHFKTQLGNLTSTESIATLLDSYPSSSELHLVAGVVRDFKNFDTKNGKAARGVISDGVNSFEFVAFNEAYEPAKEWFNKNEFVLMTVKVKEDRYNAGQNSYQVEAIRNLQEAQMFMADRLHVGIPKEKIDKLKEFVSANRGHLPISLWHPENGTYAPSKEPRMTINATPELIESMRAELGPHVKFGFPKEPIRITAPKKYDNSRPRK